MHHRQKSFNSLIASALLLAGFLTSLRPVAACEVALPANYTYAETLRFQSEQLPVGLSVAYDAPAWVLAEGPVAYAQLRNNGRQEIYLLYASQLPTNLIELENGAPVDSALWTAALSLKPGDTLEIFGEGQLMNFAPDWQILNQNRVSGGAIPTEAPPTQTGAYYLVIDQKLWLLPFSNSYTKNPLFKPEGTFHQPTLAEKVDRAPFVLLGAALSPGGSDGSPHATIQVEQWLKGTGPAEITVQGFGQSSCSYQIATGERRVFYVTAVNPTTFELQGGETGFFEASDPPNVAGSISRHLGQAPATPATAPLATTFFTAPWLFIGALVGVAMLTFVWRSRVVKDVV